MKGQSIGERIAEMMARTAYRDIRDGIGGSFRVSPPLVAAQLGIIQAKRGENVVRALETRYGSTLIHESPLRYAWDAHCRQTKPKEDTVLYRMAGAIAVRQFAGVAYTGSSLGDYAWIIERRKETLRTAVVDAEQWLDELCHSGLCDLIHAFRIAA